MEPGGKRSSMVQRESRNTKTVYLSYRCYFDSGYFICVFNLVNSRSGRAIMAIRDNRIAAESVGINITKYKLIAFTISAAIAGAGGVLYAHNLSTLIALPQQTLVTTCPS